MRNGQAARALAWAKVAVGMLGVLMLGACGGGGGGGGGGGSGGGGVPALTLASDVRPLASGDRRTWKMVAGPSAGLVRHERVGDAVAGLAGAFRVRSLDNGALAPASEEVLQRTATGIASVPDAGSDALSRAAGPVEVLRFGIPQGQSVVLYDRTLSADVDGDGRADSVDLRIDALFVGLEPLTTALAAFADTSHVRTTARSTIRGAASGTQTVTVVIDEWYVPGIGQVRSSSSTSVNGGAGVVETEELVAYGVGARHSDVVAPTVVKTVPQSGSTGGAVINAQVQFSEPVDPVAVSDGAVALVRNGSAVAAQTAQLSADGTTVTLSLAGGVLPDGAYEIRHGGQLTDWAGNPAPAVLGSFVIDTTGPRLASSSPVQGATDAPLTGTLTFTFDEPLVAPAGAALQVGIRPVLGDVPQLLPATLQGRQVVATVSTPLQRNVEYVAWVNTALTDASGNVASSSGVSFRTEAGPLGRPQAWVSDVVVDSVATADIDGDGRADLVFTANASTVKFVGARLQRPDGSYAEARRLYTPPADVTCGFDGLTVADVDGDGRADIVMHGACSPLQSTAVLLQAADGSFSLQTPPLDLIYARAAPELTGGQPGVVGVVSGTGGQSFLHLRRQPDGSWQQTPLVTTPSALVAHWQPVDLNADGRADLVWVQAAADNIGYELAWALRTDAGWGAVQSLRLPDGAPRSLVAGRLDDSGRVGVALSADVPTAFGAHSELWLMTKTAAQPFTGTPQRLAADAGATALLMADLNADGRMDLVLAHDSSYRLGVYLQGGDGAFDAERLFESPYGYFGYQRRALARADLNGDGLLDIVVGGQYLPAKAQQGAWPLAAPPRPTASATASTTRSLKAAVKALGASTR